MSYTGTDGPAGSYKAIAASATNVVLGGNGNTGDFLEQILIVPAAAAPGAVSITDGSGSAITIFVGGATITTTAPFVFTIRAF